MRPHGDSRSVTMTQDKRQETRDREGEGGDFYYKRKEWTSTSQNKKGGLLMYKTKGVDDHIYATCCNSTLLHFGHLRLVGKILTSLECP